MDATEYQISLPVFEGPFDLLLHLIREKEIDIYDIPIAQITEEYLAYLRRMEELDLEVASSFLVMAATLLVIKARMMLPKPVVEGAEEVEEDPRASLVHDLLEYESFKRAAETMSMIRGEQQNYFSRDNEISMYASLFVAEHPLAGKTLSDLQRAFDKVLRRAEERGDLLLKVRRDQVTLRDRLEYVYRMLAEHPEGLIFSQAFDHCRSRMEFIVTFLAVLELVRQGVATVSQTGQFGEIYLYVGELTNYVCE